jgi:CheY-like chemotaxis protein
MSIDHRIASGFVAGSRLRGAILARMKRAKLTEAEKNRVLAKILRAPELVKRSAKVIPFFKP